MASAKFQIICVPPTILMCVVKLHLCEATSSESFFIGKPKYYILSLVTLSLVGQWNATYLMGSYMITAYLSIGILYCLIWISYCRQVTSVY